MNKPLVGIGLELAAICGQEGFDLLVSHLLQKGVVVQRLPISRRAPRAVLASELLKTLSLRSVASMVSRQLPTYSTGT
jgi:hypothetical protein